MEKKLSADTELSVYEHLEEFRYRLLICLGTIVFFTILASYFSTQIFYHIKKAGEFPDKLVFFGPYDGFLVYFYISLFSGIVISFPIILYEIWMFVYPGLYENERRLVTLFIFMSSFFFFSGILFAYFIGIPFILKFLLDFGIKYSISPMLDVNQYLSFILWSAIIFGVIFEWPVLIYFLARLGVISTFTLIKKRKYAFLLTFIIAGIITPSGILSLFLFAIPLYVLYEIGILLTKFIKPC